MHRFVRRLVLALLVVVALKNIVISLYSLSPTLPVARLLKSDGIAGNSTDPHRSQLKRQIYNTGSKYRAQLHLMPKCLRETKSALPVTMTAEEFRSSPTSKTGNPLIDTYGENDMLLAGEKGRGVTFVDKEKEEAASLQELFHVNVMASDVIPLNRMVPDSRLEGCEKLTYEHDLPTASIIIPFYDEWPSVLLRTVYSIVNRTPRHLLQEVLLIDDKSTMEELGEPLSRYLEDYFPRGLVRLLRMPERHGLIRARMRGWEESKGDVVVFFDSHMEVNIDWLQPLLAEIKKDRHTVAMSVLDYIDHDTLEYRFNRGFLVQYGFNWGLKFFEFLFRDDQIGSTLQSARPGAIMVGAAFAMDRKYFDELGGYDMGMKVWGGENLEMAWRVWMCGGRLLHLPCSHLGHIARSQPYSFPEGRLQIEMFNYKRAAEVWMGPHKKFFYDFYHDIKSLDAGDLSERIALRDRLKCHNFTWYIHNIWPELTIYDENAIAWGSLVNGKSKMCLDTHNHMQQAAGELLSFVCHHNLNTQGCTLTREGLLRTTLHCLVVKDTNPGARPMIEDCFTGPGDKWTHTKHGPVVHLKTGLCLDEDSQGPVMHTCHPNVTSQMWSFTNYVLT
ncbi:hypothetical protein BaRGS_00017362 [Batillaria attramentaria]|uniref:Polypeptide N-acetylgalactosaminyltransferase n=1 Tax=Batillaria attramentaria TaxID=370345 RepID=A0ABD0KVY2_9CAEN